MSLDISLYTNGYVEKECHHCGSTYKTQEVLFEYNITHNLNKMAEKAGIYRALWYPEDFAIDEDTDTYAEKLIKPLEKGLKKLLCKPMYYKRFNPPNGWGSYEGLVKCVTEYLEACKKYPDAVVEISR